MTLNTTPSPANNGVNHAMAMYYLTPNSLPGEEWVPFFVGITPYGVSNLGRVKCANETQRVLHYVYVNTRSPKVRLHFRETPGGIKRLAIRSVPMLVAEHFLPQSPFKRLVHRDENPNNCRADNLFWADYKRSTVVMGVDGEVVAVKAKGQPKAAEDLNTETETFEDYYARGMWTYDYTAHIFAKMGVLRPFTMERRPDLPNQEHLPLHARRSIPLAEWEAMKTYNNAPTPTHLYPDTSNNPPRYTLSTVSQMDAHGNALPSPFPVIPEKLPEEDARDIEDSGLYFSQARVADRAYTSLVRKEDRTPLEEAALKNLKKVLDYE